MPLFGMVNLAILHTGRQVDLFGVAGQVAGGGGYGNGAQRDTRCDRIQECFGKVHCLGFGG